MGTQLVTERRITYGDSAGGLAPSATADVGTELRERIGPSDEVRFSAGVLARLKCELNTETCYIFPLAVKNLRRTGSIFYKAVGGDLKFENETLGAGKERLVVRPIVSMNEELWEELGPPDSSDGVSLFSDLLSVG